jgi:lysozyme
MTDVEDMAKVLDVSRWQGDVNFSDAFAAGYKGVAIRCTVGNYYQDVKFQEYWENAKNAGFMVSAYHVVAPANTGIIITPEEQISYFLSFLGDRVLDFPLVLDCELARGQTKTTITNCINGCVTLLEDFGYEKLLIYTRTSWWDTNVYMDNEAKKHDLWIARYSNVLTHPWGDGYYKPRDWDDWVLWQWSEQGQVPGFSGNDVDLDRFNGTINEFYKYCGVTMYPKIVRAYTYMRGTPVLSLPAQDRNNILYFVKHGTEFEALEVVQDPDSKYKFYRTIVGYIPTWMCRDK